MLDDEFRQSVVAGLGQFNAVVVRRKGLDGRRTQTEDLLVVGKQIHHPEPRIDAGHRGNRQRTIEHERPALGLFVDSSDKFWREECG